MASSLSWIDYSTKDRDAMLNVVHLFREQDTRDELGIGVIRDAFSNYFFPGTTTLQTRARYLLIVPWIYRNLERKKIKSSAISQRARADEIRLIKILKDSSEVLEGIIGTRSGIELKRLPSSIYWIGLGSWGIRLFPGNQYQYHRYIDSYYARMKHLVFTDDGEPLSGRLTHNWHQGLPDMPDDLFEHATLDLTREEALYLKERIITCHPESLLHYITLSDELFETRYIWDHPISDSVPEKLRKEISDSHNFSLVMNGASLLYNFMLSEKKQNEEFIEEYTERLVQWKDDIEGRIETISSWVSRLEQFWSERYFTHSRIHPLTKKFIENWCHEVIASEGYKNVDENIHTREIVYTRELQLKRTRARLENQRALELWMGESGAGKMDFRWGTAIRLVNDIINPLNKEQ